MSFRTSGRLIKKFDTVQVSEKFRKKEFVIEIADGKYPQTVLFQLTGDKCALLDLVDLDYIVDVEFNLRGREWTSPKGEVKFFNTLDAWKIDSRGGNGQSAPQPASDAGDMGDLPF